MNVKLLFCNDLTQVKWDGMGEKGNINMLHDFVYVSPKEYEPVKKELIKLIHEVQNYVRDEFTFKYCFVGSASRNMITRDQKSNIGYDFDVNIEVNDEDENYGPNEIRNILRNAFNNVAPRYGYGFCSDSTKVLRIKKVETIFSRILHSCDFAIVYNCSDGRQQYIRFNKEKQNYTWEYRPKGFGLETKEKWLKRNHYWNGVRKYYLYKKNTNEDPDKKSISLYAETVNELYEKYNH